MPGRRRPSARAYGPGTCASSPGACCLHLPCDASIAAPGHERTANNRRRALLTITPIACSLEVIRMLVPRLLRFAVVVAIILLPTLGGQVVAEREDDSDGGPPTATPIKHLIIIFQENISFDHYFGTYPNALNPTGE